MQQYKQYNFQVEIPNKIRNNMRKGLCQIADASSRSLREAHVLYITQD